MHGDDGETHGVIHPCIKYIGSSLYEDMETKLVGGCTGEKGWCGEEKRSYIWVLEVEPWKETKRPSLCIVIPWFFKA